MSRFQAVEDELDAIGVRLSAIDEQLRRIESDSRGLARQPGRLHVSVLASARGRFQRSRGPHPAG